MSLKLPVRVDARRNSALVASVPAGLCEGKSYAKHSPRAAGRQGVLQALPADRNFALSSGHQERQGRRMDTRAHAILRKTFPLPCRREGRALREYAFALRSGAHVPGSPSRLDSGLEVRLRNWFDRPYDDAISAARTCYSPRVIYAEEVTEKQRKSIGPLTFFGGHHT